MEEKHEKIEYILERLREPERLLEEEFVSWLQEETNKRVFEEVITNRMAFLQKEYGQQVEPELEWQQLWKQMQEDTHTLKPDRKRRTENMVLRCCRDMHITSLGRWLVVTTERQ